LREIKGMSRKDVTKALAITFERQELFIKKWSEIHG